MTPDEIILDQMAEMDKYRDYGRYPIPCTLDEMICELLSRINDHKSYLTLKKRISPEHLVALVGFAHRAPTWAVRERSPKILIQGLLALALAGWEGIHQPSSFRRWIVDEKGKLAVDLDGVIPDVDIELFVIPLYGRAAYLIGVPREGVFAEAIRIAEGGFIAQALKCYLRDAPLDDRPVDDVFREVQDENGFRFEMKPLWRE